MPILGKSTMISTIVKAHGNIMIPAGVEGIEANEEAIVCLF